MTQSNLEVQYVASRHAIPSLVRRDAASLELERAFDHVRRAGGWLCRQDVVVLVAELRRFLPACDQVAA